MDCMRACSSLLLRLVLTTKSGFFLHAHTHYAVHSAATLVDATAFDLSDGVFLPTIQSQATDEQREKWVPLIRDYRIIGAYAQTEMGHGNTFFITVKVSHNTANLGTFATDRLP